ncbi:DHS-like NAD/FAD-binding domain-containing protein [Irpex rosettiformis]|uniref:DHS-like NAD/FAD-binding domain-containing protein n=1 Tax=Irpex rosettiformis TaxID=378272 RepID=A0ACB8ULR2_9APHY|nr:DHS-like NAD/FAD-binding domain-containing protein [Irpex rosettiformis]
MSSDADAFRTALRSSKNIIAIAGAGLSAASGIPTFRSANGLWRNHDPVQLATPQAFDKNPSLVWQFYNTRRTTALNASPNAAHMALAMLCCPDMLQVLAPSQANFTLITQNIDGLSTRALKDVLAKRDGERQDSQPSMIYEMHGRLFDIICTTCSHIETNYDPSLCPALSETQQNCSNDKNTCADIPLELLPRCAKCGGLLRPGVVWFDEKPRHLTQIWSLVDKADMCLVIGTSNTVQPAAGFACEVKDHGGTVAVFNVEWNPDPEFDLNPDFLFLGPCEETLPKVLFNID